MTEGVDPTVEVILPPTVDCDDDYIQFLEYNDRKVGSIHPPLVSPANGSQGSRTGTIL